MLELRNAFAIMHDFSCCWCWYKSIQELCILMRLLIWPTERSTWLFVWKQNKKSKSMSQESNWADSRFSFMCWCCLHCFSLCFPRPAGVYFTLLGSQGLRLLGHFYGCGRTGKTGWESAICYARKHGWFAVSIYFGKGVGCVPCITV